MRYITGGIALGSALALGGLVAAGTSATAAPTPAPAPQIQSLYAPSALVLTIGQGDTAATAGVQRAVTLTCTPKASGSHPDVVGACAQLRAAEGNFKDLTEARSGSACTKEWRPITVTAQGVWEGQRVNYEHVFGNPCMAKSAKGSVFEF